MELFPHEQITQLGPNEMRVYNYVIMHIEDVPSMSIRTLAKEVGVSTTTVLRFCEKVGCEGYQELKYLIKRKVEDDVLQDVIFPQDQARAHQFLREAGSDPRIVERIKRASALIASARSTAFLGVGTSANLAEYGARYFANLGLPSISVLDPFFPRVTYDVTGTVLVALSVSGSTEQVMMQTEAYKEHGAQIITITNADDCPLARIADVALSYYMPFVALPGPLGYHNVTTQLPVLYYLETLGRASYSVLNGNR